MVQYLSGIHKAQCLIPGTAKVLWGRKWDLNLVYNAGLHSCISCPHSMGILKYLLDCYLNKLSVLAMYISVVSIPSNVHTYTQKERMRNGSLDTLKFYRNAPDFSKCK